MKHLHHSTFLSDNVNPGITISAEDGVDRTILRFERLSELILSYYHEYKYEYIKAKPYYALSREGAESIDNEFPKLYGKDTTEFMHQQVRKRLIQEGKIRAGLDYEGFTLPPKFVKLTYQQIVDTLLWYAQYSPKEERELIMEFLLTDGRCGGKWNEFNEKNRRVQAILTQVANSQIVQQFPKE